MSERFYCPDPPQDGPIALGGEDARHLVRVLRAEPGDVVEIFDGRGRSFPARIAALARDRVLLDRIGDLREDPPLPCRLTLASAVPKGDRFDWLVEKATEIGVDVLIPLISERSVVDPGDSKLDRLRKRVVEASKQSGRNRLMVLESPRSVDRIFEDPSFDARSLAHPGGNALEAAPQRGSVAVAIGPEGGFSEPEVEKARKSGWSIVGLGPNKLRVETAGLVACSMILASARGGVS